jgi:hypothetical protein
MQQSNKWCKWLGHRWRPVYIGKNNKWRIIACYCERCRYGYKDIVNYLMILNFKEGYDFGTYSKNYFDKAMRDQ